MTSSFRLCALLLVALLTLLAAAQTGCQQQQPAPNPTPAPPVTTKPGRPDPALIAATNGFGLNTLRALSAADPRGNVVISPASISLALAMAYAGAVGDTRAGMARAMALGNLTPEAVHEGYRLLAAALQLPETEGKLYLANALFKQQGVPFRPAFLDLVRTDYRAEVTDLDFREQQQAADTINAWVKEQTRGTIPSIVQPNLLGQVLLAILNAVYLKAEWSKPFETDLTKDGDFTRADGSTMRLPLMSQFGHLPYYADAGVQVAELAYRGRLTMLVALPAKDADFGQFVTSLTPERLQQWQHGLKIEIGSLKLPRFTVEYSQKLNDVLAAQGMGQAFDAERADFTGALEPRSLYIGLVLHKTFLRVYEKGTEAAAVTAVMMPGMGAPPGKPFEMIVDRPFVCAIRDSVTGVLLFAAVVGSPQAGTKTE